METLNVHTEITDGLKTLLKTILEKDSVFAEQMLHSDFVFTSPRAIVMNKAQFINDFILNPAIRFQIFELTKEQVVTIDRTGVLHCLVQARPEGKDDLWERVSFTLVRDGLHWKTLAMNATFVP